MYKKTSISSDKVVSNKTIRVAANTNKIIFHNSGSDIVTILDVYTIVPGSTFELKAGENKEVLNLLDISIKFSTTTAPVLEILKFELND
jgi:hypothetical protein